MWPTPFLIRTSLLRLRDKFCSLLILQVHSYLVIATEPVKKVVAFVTCYRVENVVHEWERETIRDRCRVELSVVNVDSDFPVLLRDDDDRA